MVQEAISVVLEMDFGAMASGASGLNLTRVALNQQMMVTRVSVSSDDIDQVTIAAIANPHYWFVRLHNPGAIRASFHLIHLFGHLCGKKRCALFIDNAIANLYEDCHCHLSQSSDQL